MTSKVRAELYYANWCGHCNQFKEEWNKLKSQLDQKYGGNSWGEYEESENRQIMKEKGINGYPTIKINVNGVEKEYQGKRSAESIMNFIDDSITGKHDNGENGNNKFKQCGGSRNKHRCVGGVCSRNTNSTPKRYDLKYLKYKAKYMKLKSQNK
jgi:thiol-disulfide isomerase/thioredoxin